MSKLKLLVESEEDIPAGLSEYYEEQDDGTYRLNVEGAKSEGDVARVKEALEKERKQRRDAERRAKEAEEKIEALPDDFDVDEYERLKAAGGDTDVQAKIEEARERERKRHEKVLEQIRRERDEAVTANRTLTTRQALKEGLDGINVAPKLRRAAERVWLSDIEIDDDGNAVTKDGTPLSDALRDWAESEEGSYFIAAPPNGGGGAAGGRGGSGKKFQDYTEQELVDLYKRDPAAYRRLRDSQ